jgi:4-amino-4-deoxy-L-arabinose transferase-like glycosyltransferase
MEKPTAARAAIAGAAIGLAALTRAEGLALLVLALLPAALMGAAPRRRALAPIAAGLLACAVVLAPWTIRNWSAFDRPILISTNSGTLLSGANCDQTYHGRLTGSWSIRCVDLGTSRNEAVAAAHARSHGLGYATDHLSRLPAVLAVRVLRTFDLYQPVAEARIAESRAYGLEVIGAACFWLLLPVAAYGAFQLRRRGQPLILLAAPFVLVIGVSLIGYGVPRFRLPADLVVLVLAAVAYDVALSRRAAR